MTGYGRGSSSGSRYRVSIEIRSVNGRFFEFRAKLPRSLLFLEAKIRELCSKKIKRGAVDLVLNLQALVPVSEASVDTALARAYAKEVAALASGLDLSEGLSAAALLRLPGVLVDREPEPLESDSEIPELIYTAVADALEHLLEMRKHEGEKLSKVLLRELGEIRTHADWIQKHREDLNERYFKKLQLRLKDWSEKSQTRIDESRLYQEVAFYLDRSDVVEELDRLTSHLKQCDDAIHGGAPGSVGKRLDFLAQELGREVNTIGSKNDHVQVTTHVVEMKMALERLREQVQNLE